MAWTLWTGGLSPSDNFSLKSIMVGCPNILLAPSPDPMENRLGKLGMAGPSSSCSQYWHSNNLNSTLHNFDLFAFVNYQVEKPFRRKDLYCTSFYLVFKNILFWPFHGHFWNVLSLKITNNVPSRSADFHTICYMFPKKVFLKRFKSFFMHFMH